MLRAIRPADGLRFGLFLLTIILALTALANDPAEARGRRKHFRGPAYTPPVVTPPKWHPQPKWHPKPGQRWHPHHHDGDDGDDNDDGGRDGGGYHDGPPAKGSSCIGQLGPGPARFFQECVGAVEVGGAPRQFGRHLDRGGQDLHSSSPTRIRRGAESFSLVCGRGVARGRVTPSVRRNGARP